MICKQNQIATSLVGTVQDVREFAAWRSGQWPKSKIPALAKGWRSEIIGQSIDKALQGKLALRVDDPLSDHPLTLEEL